jgi:hypothetical protein
MILTEKGQPLENFKNLVQQYLPATLIEYIESEIKF